MSKQKSTKPKGLSDAEFVHKYKSGKIDMEKTLKQMFNTGKNALN